MSIAGSQLIYDFLSQPTETPFVDSAWTNIETTFQNTNLTGLRASGFAVASMKVNTPATSTIIRSKMTISTNHAASFDLLAAIIVDNTTSRGYIFECNGGTGRIRRRDIGTGIGSTLGGGFAISALPGDEYELWYDTSNGLLSAVVNNVVISTQTDTTYQASTLAVGVLSDPQNNNGRRIGVFAADYLDAAGVTIDSTPSDIRVTESRTIRVTAPTTAMTTGNTAVRIDDAGNNPITPSAVTNISGLTYDVVFTVPDEYAGLPYSATGYPIIVTTTDGSVTSSNVDFLPVTGNGYVTLTDVSDTDITSSPALEVDDQIEWTNAAVITIGADGKISSTEASATFEFRVWDHNDSTWGDWAEVVFGGGGSIGNDSMIEYGVSNYGLAKYGVE